VDELPLTAEETLVQVISLEELVLMFGKVVLVVTVTAVVEAQPLAGSVTVSVYTPALVAVPLAVLPGVTPELQE
jgi:hypothetical protein